MKPEIYINRKSIYQTYLELEPKGTNQFAPRIGYYQVIRNCRVYMPKHALEGVVVLWKLNSEDEFDTSFETRIQLESFKRNPYPGSAELLTSDLTGKIIHIKGAAKDSTGKFIVEWSILSSGNKDMLKQLNKLMVQDPTVLDGMLSDDLLSDTDLENNHDYFY